MEWCRRSTHGSVSKLTAVSHEQVVDFIRKADRILARNGKRAGELLRAEVDDGHHTPNPELKARDPKVLRQALKHLPNDDLDYESWVRIGYAIKGCAR